MGALGYGSDLSCASDLDSMMSEVDPNSLDALAEAIYRRFDTPEGGLIDDETYGKDLRQYVNRGYTFAEIDALSAEIRAEAERDDRVDSVVVTVTVGGVPFGSVLKVVLRVLPVDPALGVFTMTLRVTDAGVLLEEIAR